ncbi:GNAT family N-acetyltransferase [Enterococcus devriesei]|uniref:GNAT family N-acetyltransferase n=1 Tax=Enterococcus devriesei TaxID=319970 RepID=UPI0028A582BA|nr:GNAT family N-acetyltransferase [Enterococcus devriesei]
MKIVSAKENDVPIILKLIKELAEYEGLLDEVTATEDDLTESLFEQKQAQVLLVEEADEVIGFALYFINYSTFIGRGGVYLEDLYVRPSYRGSGAGKALIKKLAQIAVEIGGQRLQWWCLKDNTLSLDFYEHMGAKQQDDWVVLRVSGMELEKLAEK